MGKFIREFVEFEAAKVFADSVRAEVVARYDWDVLTKQIIKTYRVSYSVR